MRAKKKTYINLILIAYSAIFRTASLNSNTRVFYASVHTCAYVTSTFYQDLNFINPASTDVMIFITPASTYTVFFHQSRFNFQDDFHQFRFHLGLHGFFYQLRVNFHGDFSSIPLPCPRQYFLQSCFHLYGDFSTNTASDDNVIFSSIGPYSLITWISQSTLPICTDSLCLEYGDAVRKTAAYSVVECCLSVVNYLHYKLTYLPTRCERGN